MRKNKLMKYLMYGGLAYLAYTMFAGSGASSMAGLGKLPAGWNTWSKQRKQAWMNRYYGGGYGGSTNQPDTFTPPGYGNPFGGGYTGYGYGSPDTFTGWGGPYYNPVYNEQAGSIASIAAQLDASSEGN